MATIADLKRIAEVEFFDWENISTFPYHFHQDSQKNVKASPFPLAVIDGFRAFMEFVRNKIKK